MFRFFPALLQPGVTPKGREYQLVFPERAEKQFMTVSLLPLWEKVA
jgi:hypothetical protein